MLHVTELRKQMALLEQARECATLKNASFKDIHKQEFIFAMMPKRDVTNAIAFCSHEEKEFRKVETDEFIKSRVELHHQTWIIANLNEVIAWMKQQVENGE